MSRTLIRDSTIYGLGTVLTRGVNFLLLPLYTRYLNVEEFGALSLLNLILQNVSFVCLMGLSTAATRFYFDEGADADYRGRVYGTATGLMLIMPLLVLLVLGPIIWFLTTRYLTSIAFMPLILLVLLTGLFTPMQKLMAGLLRNQRRPMSFVAFNFGFFIFQATTIVLALAWLKLGIEGQIYAQFLAQAVFGVIALVVLWQYSRPVLSWPMAGKLLRYGIPLIPFFIFLWLNEASGRFLLERYGDLALLGVFALASQFGSLMSLFSASVDSAFIPHFMERASSPGGHRELGLLVARYLTLFGLMGVAITIVSPLLIRSFATPAFHDAIAYVAPLVLASWLQVANQSTTWSLTFSRMTGTLSAIRGLKFCVLVSLTLLFLGPLDMGISGVILAYCIANLLSFSLSFVAGQRGYRLEVPWRNLLANCSFLLLGGLVVHELASEALAPARLAVQVLVLVVLTVVTMRLVGVRQLSQLWRPPQRAKPAKPAKPASPAP